MRLRHKTQWWETNLRVGRFWVPNTFPRMNLNSKPISLIVRSMFLPQKDDIYMVPRPFQKLGGDSKTPCVYIIKQGKLQRFVRGGENPPRDPEPNWQVEERPRAQLGEIWVIIGGNTMASSSKKARTTYLRMVQSVQIFSRPPKMTRVDNPAISFTKEDTWQLHHPYDKAPVINLLIADFNTQRVLVDNGSLANILYYLAFQ